MDLKQLKLEEIMFPTYDNLRISWAIHQKSQRNFTGTPTSHRRFVRIVEPLHYGSFEELCREAFASQAHVRRVSVRGDWEQSTGKYFWHRLAPYDLGRDPMLKIELYARAAEQAGFMLVNLKTNVTHGDHEMGFEVVSGRVASANIVATGDDMPKYDCISLRRFDRVDRVVGLLVRNWSPTPVSAPPPTDRPYHPRPGQ
jgi:hypothetical protein